MLFSLSHSLTGIVRNQGSSSWCQTEERQETGKSTEQVEKIIKAKL
jgi:hypothetical protein